MMPLSDKVDDTSATQQLALLQSGDFTEVGIASVSGIIPYTTANSAIQSYAKVFIDTARYKVGVFTNSINGTLWNGEVTITSYTNDEDTATGTFTITLFDNTDNEKYADWLEQSVQKTMASREATDISVVNLFKRNESILSFRERLQWYSLDYLNIMSSMATSAITVMSEQGVANQDSLDTDVYAELYLPYLEKSRAIQDEIRTKEEELSGLLQPVDENGVQDPEYQSVGLIDVIIDRQNEIRDALDLHNYLGDELWERLSYYRRESEYSNQNYVSDGLTDSEVIKQAKDFVDVATKEIIKAATLQHTISAPLANFLLMDEFSDLQERFKVGNWIWLQVDGKVYKLRLANWEIDYDNIDDLDIEFTDVVRVGDIISDVESILSKSKSMSTTYDYTARQADKGKDAAVTVKFFKDSGIDFSKVKAITSKGNTNIVYDDDGILLKRVDVFNESPEQARIYNNGIYITRDAWETVSTGLGHFSYVDPETGENVETYGIIADTVIGKLILGENLKIYSESGKFEMGDDGLKVTAIDGEDNSDLFVVQKQKTDDQGRPYVEKYIYVDSNGDVKIAGNSITIGTKPLTEYIEDEVDEVVGDQIDDARKVATNYLSADLTGIMVADMEYGEQTPSTATGKNVFIDNDSVDVRNGQTVLSSFGDNAIIIGQYGKSRLMLSPTMISGISDIGYKNFNIISGDSSEEETTITKSGNFENESSETGVFHGSINFSEKFYYFHKVTATVVFNYIWDGEQQTTDPLTLDIDDPEDETGNIWFIGGSVVNSSYVLEYRITCSTQHNGEMTYVYFDTDAQLTPKNTSIPVSYEIESTAPYSIVIETKVYKNTSYTFGSRTRKSEQGNNSFTIGEQLIASSDNQVAIGTLNNDDPNKNYAFMVGNGVYDENHREHRSNAFAVDCDGNVENMGDLEVGESLIVDGSADNIPNITINKESTNTTDYIKCLDANLDAKFRVLNDGGAIIGNDLLVGNSQTVTNNLSVGGNETITGGLTVNGSGGIVSKGGISVTGNANVSGRLLDTSNNPLFKVGTVTVDKIGIDADIGVNKTIGVALTGYTPVAIGSFQMIDASNWIQGYAHSTWCIMGYHYLSGNNIYCYVGNWNTSSPARIKLTFTVLYIKSSAL